MKFPISAIKARSLFLLQKNGYGDLVVMSIEAYEKLVRDIQVDAAILEAEKEVREGAELVDAREALARLRRKHGA